MSIDYKTLLANSFGVFQGGGCKAIAYAGAYEVACEKGIEFSKVAGTSAGAIFAALIAAGASPEKIKEIAKSPELKAIPKLNRFEFLKSLKTNISICLISIGLWILALFLQIWKFILLIFQIPLSCITAFYKNLIKKSNTKKWSEIKKDSGEKFKRSILPYRIIVRIPNALNALFTKFGIHDSSNLENTIKEWLKDILKNKQIETTITFKDLKLDLYVYSSDLKTHKITEWSTKNTPDASVAKAVAASCCIPVYFSPVSIPIYLSSETKEYHDHVDGGLLINRPDFNRGDNPNYFQTLSFKLISNEDEIKDLKSYLGALLDTLIQGADSLQHEIGFSGNTTYGKYGVNEVNIKVEDISAIEFSQLSDNDIENLINWGKEGMHKFLESLDESLSKDGAEKFFISPTNEIYYEDYLFNQIAFWSYEDVEKIYVSDDNLNWLWPMFPTLLTWVNKGCEVHVYYNQDEDGKKTDKHESLKRLLNSLGFSTHPTKKDDLIQGYFFHSKDSDKCILFSRDNELVQNTEAYRNAEKKYDSPKNLTDEEKKKQFPNIAGKVYNSKVDSIFIKSIIEVLTSNQSTPASNNTQISISKVDDTSKLINLLSVGYPNNGMPVEIKYNPNFEIRRLCFLKQKIRSLKFKELRVIWDLYKDMGIDYFYPAELTLPDGKKSLMTPIVVEKHGDKYIVIKGNARCFKVYKEKGENATVPVFIVKNAPIIDESKELYSIKNLKLSEKKNWGASKLSTIRPIDQMIRPNKSYLT